MENPNTKSEGTAPTHHTEHGLKRLARLADAVKLYATNPDALDDDAREVLACDACHLMRDFGFFVSVWSPADIESEELTRDEKFEILSDLDNCESICGTVRDCIDELVFDIERRKAREAEEAKEGGAK